MRRIIKAMALSAAALASSAASAQNWGVYIGNDRGYDGEYRDSDDNYRLARWICSGARAQGLEARLRHEEDEDEIDGYDARRIHSSIDRLEDRQRHECNEGDWRSIRDIASRYDQIGQWIDAEAHGQRPDGW